MNPTDHWFKATPREMSRQECFELLDENQVGRIAFNDSTGPVVLPVNYVVDDGAIVIATSDGSSLDSFAAGERVAFEVDEVDEFNENGTSVLVRGHAARVPSSSVPEHRRPYTWPAGRREVLLQIVPSQVTGRRLIPT
jgi:nitroimidazol reductase NimA-like FMN-containing flavoprotein (pyridoxamine 5'-phosphate oxidase superfamily)